MFLALAQQHRGVCHAPAVLPCPGALNGITRFTALSLVSLIIALFLALATAEADGTVRRLPRRRRTRSLGQWLPERSTFSQAEPESGPVPPFAT